METQDIGKIIKLLNEKMRMYADADLKKHGLTFAQAHLLCFLHKHNGKATQKEIEMDLEISHPAVVKLVARLSDAGFITCHPDEKDRRNKIVCTTEKAVNLRNHIERERKNTEAKLTAGLTEAEKAELLRLLKILNKNFE